MKNIKIWEILLWAIIGIGWGNLSAHVLHFSWWLGLIILIPIVIVSITIEEIILIKIENKKTK